MKKIIIIVATIILIALGVKGFMYFASFGESTQYQSQGNTQGKTLYELCKSGGGKLRGFSNGCGDACVSKEKGIMFCTDKPEQGCDCGENKCWDGRKCVKDKK